jgi:hypothetical protein
MQPKCRYLGWRLTGTFFFFSAFLITIFVRIRLLYLNCVVCVCVKQCFRTKSLSNKIAFEQKSFRTKSLSNKIAFEQKRFRTKSLSNKGQRPTQPFRILEKKLMVSCQTEFKLALSESTYLRTQVLTLLFASKPPFFLFQNGWSWFDEILRMYFFRWKRHYHCKFMQLDKERNFVTYAIPRSSMWA